MTQIEKERTIPRTVGVLVFDDVEVLDFSGPFEVFFAARLEGQPDEGPALFDVVTIAEERRPVRCSGDLVVLPQYTVDDHPALDILVVPGGDGTRREIHNRRLLDWITAWNRRTEITMSVCTGALLLAECGILDGLQATTHWYRVDWMRGLYPAIEMVNGVRLVDTGHVVTSAGISAGIDLALHVVERLHGPSAAAWTARRMEHMWSEQYRSIFESSSDAVLILDAEGRIVETNTRACELFGYTREEMSGMPARELTRPELREAIDEHVRTVSHVGSGDTRTVCLRKDGTHFEAELRSTPFEYHGVPHVLSMIRDVTARVEAERAVLEERQRLARDLHDSVSQALFGIGLGARTAQAMLERDPEEAARSISYVLSLAQSGMAEMRALLFELRPESLETEGLVQALQKQADAVRARYEIPVSPSLCDEPPLPLAAKEALYRIAQEALHNTVKHARPRSVDLSLQRREREVVLEIRDDGEGFDTGGSFPGHLGLHSMRERAQQVGGTLEVVSRIGYGTRVQVCVPTGAAV